MEKADRSRVFFMEEDAILLFCFLFVPIGGTVDITVHTVEGADRLREVHRVTGSPWGGITVNDAFCGFLENIFGHNIMLKFAKEDPSDFMEMMRHFENRKRSIALDSSGRTIVFLPTSLRKLVKRETKMKFPEVVSKTVYASRIEPKDDKLFVDVDIFKTFFQTAVDSISGHVSQLLDDLKSVEIKTILMVGGFSESPFVAETIRRTFPDKKVIIPLDAGIAVLKGAVLFGYRPDVVVARVAAYTYGVAMNRKFKPGIDPEDNKQTKDGIDYCMDCFSTFVQIGEPIKSGASFDIPFRNVSKSPAKKHVSTTHPVYVSNQRTPAFVTDPGCQRLGRIRQDPPVKGWPEIVEGHLEMSIGGTEITVTAVYKTLGTRTKADFKILI